MDYASIASKIIALAAKRELVRGLVIKNESADYAKFLSASGFSYTSDQQKAVGAILEDLQSGKADRSAIATLRIEKVD